MIPATDPPRPRAGAALLLLLLLATLAACVAAPPAPVPPVRPRHRTVDVLDYAFHVDLDHEAGHVEGQTTVTFRGLPGLPADTLVLDAVDLLVSSVSDGDGRLLDFATGRDTLTIHLPERLLPGEEGVVHVRYEAWPRRGIYFVPPSGRDPGRPWHVWTQGQPEETRHWAPVWDQLTDRATHTLHLTVDDDLLTMGAGRLVESIPQPRRGRRTDVWRMDVPHVAYLVTFVAGGMARAELEGGPVPLPVLADPDDLDLAVENTGRTGEILRFMEELTGVPYPYGKYAQSFVHDYTAGGMENISATTLYAEGIHDPDDEPQVDPLGLLAHEAAHQWFGDLVTCDSWAHLWLNEGFADYAEALYLESVHGPARFAAIMRDYQRTYLRTERADSRPVVWSGYAHPDETFDDRAYNGAAARLHLLRDQIGDEAFLAGVRLWCRRHGEDVVDTADVQRVMEEAAGRSLAVFFDEWFRGRGFPVLEATVENGDAASPVLEIRQVQSEEGWRPVFHVALDVAWSRGGVEERKRVVLDRVLVRVPLDGEGVVDWVRPDAGGVLVGEIRMDQDASQWIAQLVASDPLTRLVAAEHLARRADDAARTAPDGEPVLPEASREALATAALEDPFVDVRTAALAALGSAPSPRTATLALDLITDPDPRLREAAVALAGLAPDDVARAALRAATRDENAAVAFEAFAALAALDEPGLVDTIAGVLATTPKVRLARDLVELLPHVTGGDPLPVVVRTARHHPERWVRSAAVEALEAFASGDPPVADLVWREVARAIHDESYQVRASAAATLGRLGDPRGRPVLEGRGLVEDDPTVLAALGDALDALR